MTGPLEGGDVWGPRHGTPHGASPPSSGHEPEATYQRQAEADFGAGRGSDTKGAGSPDIPRPTNLADICVECGSGLLKGQHIADYPCLRRAEVAERERDQARQALERVFCEELNGRLCPLPDSPGVNCCDNCRETWRQVMAALERPS